MSRSVLGVVVLLAAFMSVGCDNTTQVAPTDPPAVITESFAGTLNINGAVTYPFVVGTPGSVTATLVTVGPNSESQIGMSLGSWNTATETCQVVISSDLAVQGKVIIGSANSSGAFCVRVYDVGRITESASFEISVSHQ